MPVVKFDQLRTPQHLAGLWGVAPEDLDLIAQTTDMSAHYQKLDIPKSGKKNFGKYRTVFKLVWGVLHQLQKNIARDIGDSTSFPDCVQGFVAGRSTVTNARVHVGQPVVLHADIQDFFDSIKTQQVKQAFVGLGCDFVIADLLTKICTLQGRLPQGASTSPILANLVCVGLDTQLLRFAAQQGVLYSRYADDLTFSGKAPPDIAAVRRILETHGFKLREDKVRTQWRGKGQYVTGLSIADAAGPRIPARMKQRLRQQLYYATKYGVEGHQQRVGDTSRPHHLLDHWRGWIDYINSVPLDRPLAVRLRQQLDALSVEE